MRWTMGVSAELAIEVVRVPRSEMERTPRRRSVMGLEGVGVVLGMGERA